MRKLTDTRDRDEARRLVDSLLVASIDACVRSEAGTDVWVLDDEQVAAARVHLERFGRGEIEDVGAEADRIRRKRSRDDAAHAAGGQRPARRWQDSPALVPSVLTLFLVAASVLIALLGWYLQDTGQHMWNLTIDDWSSGRFLGRVREGQVWRLVTPIFLHFGGFHLLFNMLWVLRFGPQVEREHGSLVLAGLVFACAIVGNIGQYLLTGPAFGGMSGVVYGLFGFVWMHATFEPRRGYHVDGVTVVLTMAWFLACATGAFGPIANVAHAAGLVVGILCGLPPYLRHLQTRGPAATVTPGTWADVHLTGFRRFRWRWLSPYVPLWFLALAALVIVLEPLTTGRPRAARHEACESYVRVVNECMGELPVADRPAFYDRIEAASEDLQGAGARGIEEVDRMCAEVLPHVRAVAVAFGCARSLTVEEH